MSLFLDTSNFKLIVGIIDEENNKVVSYYNEEVKGDMSSKALCVVRDLIEKSKLIPDDIDKIYIVNGPGSFTGIRIGVTIAKVFAWSLNKKIIPISSLEVLASTNCDTEYVVSMIDARRKCVYAGIYDKELNTYMEDKYISLEELETKLPNSYTYVSDDDIESLNLKESNIDLLKIINKHKNDEGTNPHHLNPNYLKITEAEANLKKND